MRCRAGESVPLWTAVTAVRLQQCYFTSTSVAVKQYLKKDGHNRLTEDVNRKMLRQVMLKEQLNSAWAFVQSVDDNENFEYAERSFDDASWTTTDSDFHADYMNMTVYELAPKYLADDCVPVSAVANRCHFRSADSPDACPSENRDLAVSSVVDWNSARRPQSRVADCVNVCQTLKGSLVFSPVCGLLVFRYTNVLIVRAALRLVRARVLCQMRAPYRPVIS